MIQIKKIVFLFGAFFFLLTCFGQEEGMALVKGGTYTPLYGGDSISITIPSFYMDIYPVTNAEYIEFLKENPKWRKSKIIRLFADEHYLSHFQDDLTLKPNEGMRDAVTSVSWHAAKEYCKCQGKRLPTMDEWELAAMADETSPDARDKKEFNQYLLSWYEKSKFKGKEIGKTYKNYWGIYDLHGLVWEWTADFNSVPLSQDTRNSAEGNNNLYCGGAAYGANDLKNYAAFMRYAFRSSVRGDYSIKNLGFRCAKSIK